MCFLLNEMIKQVGELAKSFLWDPFFRITLDDFLMHVLQLLSTHRLQILPVMEQPNSEVIGFVTQVFHLLQPYPDFGIKLTSYLMKSDSHSLKNNCLTLVECSNPIASSIQWTGVVW